MSWTGPRPQWTPEQWRTLLGPRLLDRPKLAPGKARRMIHHPASWLSADLPHSDSTHNMAQFYTLPAAAREALDETVLAAWKAGPFAGKFTLGISCHLSMVDPFSQYGLARYWDSSDHAELAAMWDGVIWPWHELLGAGSRPGPGLYEWGMEGVFTDVDHRGRPGGWPMSAALRAYLPTQKIKPIGEAVPMKDGKVDVDKAQEMPCWCLPEFADGNIAGQDVHGCPEAHLLLAGQWEGGQYLPTATVEQVIAWTERGFIVGGDAPHDPVILEAREKMGLPIG